jgi:hypothetical protein
VFGRCSLTLGIFIKLRDRVGRCSLTKLKDRIGMMQFNFEC